MGTLANSEDPDEMQHTQVIYRFVLAQMECKVNVLLNNC